MKKLIILATLAVASCSEAPTAENTQTVAVGGRTAYVVSAGGVLPDEATTNRILSKTSTPADIAFIINGTHGAGLPARAAKLCPSGYDVLSQTAPTARPEGSGVWSANAKFTIACK